MVRNQSRALLIPGIIIILFLLDHSLFSWCVNYESFFEKWCVENCRGYYKCSSMRGCPARKHVERCVEDPAMLIVTYEAEHSHPKLPSQAVTT